MTQSAHTVIAGDIGGTKVLLRLVEIGEDRALRTIQESHFDSDAFPDLVSVVRAFFQQLSHHHAGAPESACFGVAGPIELEGGRQRAKLTNLPWTLDTTVLAEALRIHRIKLINDFEAVGHGIDAMGPHDLATLQPGIARSDGVRAVIGAGTGLGQAILVRNEGRYQVIATEGGHVDFAPTNDLQFELWRELSREFGHVSYERLLSGSGLVRIFRFLRERRVTPDSISPAMDLAAADAPATISRAALSGTDPLAASALDVFIDIFGAQAGNLALSTLAYGGVFVAGGIAPKIIDRIKAGGFMRAFSAKGRMSPLLAEMPVHVVTNEKVGLSGAAIVAAKIAR